jgi:hypothetical protein
MAAVDDGRRPVIMMSVAVILTAGGPVRIMLVGMMPMMASAVAAIALLGAARFARRPGRPGPPQAVGGTGGVVAGEDLQRGPVAGQRVGVGQQQLAGEGRGITASLRKIFSGLLIHH